MRKNRKLWSYALAGAMAVSNLSGVVAAPFTTIVAQAQGEVVYGDITVDNQIAQGAYAEATIVATWTDDNNPPQIQDLVWEVTGFPVQGKADDIDVTTVTTPSQWTGSNSNYTATHKVKIVVDAEAKLGSYTISVEGKQATFEVTEAEPAALPTSFTFKNTRKDGQTSDVKNIPDKGLAANMTGFGSEGLELEATETFEDEAGAGTDFAYYLVSGTEDMSANFTLAGINDEWDTTDHKKFTKEFTIAVNDQMVGETAVGDYTFGAYIEKNGVDGYNAGEDLFLKEYTFSVVGLPEGTFTIKDKNADEPAAIDIGKTVQLKVWNKGKSVEDTKVKWESATPAVATVSTKGLVTGVANGNSDVSAEYTINNDLALKVDPVNISVNPEVPVTDDYVLKFDGVDTNKGTEPVTIVEGESADAILTYGHEGAFEPVSVTWQSTNTSKVTVSGNTFTGVAPGDGIVVNGTYDSKEGEAKTIALTVTVEEKTAPQPAEPAYFIDGEVANEISLFPGETTQLEYMYDDRTAIEGKVTWAVVSGPGKVNADGLVTVNSDAAANSEIKVQASVDNTEVEGLVTITVKADEYVIEADENELYFGQSATLTATYNDQPFTGGTFAFDAAAAHKTDYFAISGNKIEAIAVNNTDADIETQVVLMVDEVAKGDPITITLKKDDLKVESNVTEGLWDVEDGTTAATAEIASLEIGEKIEISAVYGTEDLTDKMKWTSDNEAIKKTGNGTFEVVSEYADDIILKGEYTITPQAGTATTFTATLTVKKVVESTGAAEAAAGIEKKADEASQNAEAAYDSAVDAIEAADDAKKNPTADNLHAAEDALAKANSELSAAEKALEEAQKALDEVWDEETQTPKAGYSDSAKLAVVEAAAKVAAARDAVDEASGKVDEAKEAFAELAPEAEKLKAKEEAIANANTAAATAATNPTAENIKAAQNAIAAAEAKGATPEELKAAKDNLAKAEEAAKKNEKAADDSAKGTPAPVGTELVDANGNKTGFKVTDASASNPEVEYEGPADKNATKADIPETTTDLSGNTYKVTGIVANAFKDTKVKTVTIRKNIKKIDPKAFNKSKVKNVKIKGTKLTKKMAKSFKKLKKGGKIKCSGSHKKKNKEILNNLSTVKNGKTKVK